jgi:hypothetical protein
VARYDRQRVPRLLTAVPAERLRLRRVAGLAWGRHLGTAAGERTSGVDLTRWAWFCAWSDAASADRFHDAVQARTRPLEVATIRLEVLRSRGAWRGAELAPGDGEAAPSPVAVLTRAHVRGRRWRAFARAVPAADAALDRAAGRLASIGVGEWPVLVQGTFSIWDSTASLTAFARRDPDHADVIRRTVTEDWYAEELFARFAVTDARGTWGGRGPDTFAGCPRPTSTTPSSAS